MLRQKDIFDISEVKYGVLEINGLENNMGVRLMKLFTRKKALQYFADGPQSSNRTSNKSSNGQEILQEP